MISLRETHDQINPAFDYLLQNHEAKRKKKLLTILLVILVILVILAIGGAVFKFMFLDKQLQNDTYFRTIDDNQNITTFFEEESTNHSTIVVLQNVSSTTETFLEISETVSKPDENRIESDYFGTCSENNQVVLLMGGFNSTNQYQENPEIIRQDLKKDCFGLSW